jgi:hypothetical protein
MRAPLRSFVAATGLSVIAVLAGAPAAFAGSGVPYSDPAVVGSIGLCNKAGQQITHGSVNTTPFVWRAVSSQAAQNPYDAAGRTATFYAFQPRQDVAPGQWSGEALTASSRYTNSAHPMAAATGRDDSLKDFISDFPPSWDGLIELRIYLGAPNAQVDSLSYPATNIKVTGNTWRVVGAVAPAACGSGKSESIETILLPTPKPSNHPKAHGSSHPHASGTATPAGTTGGATPNASPTTVNAADSEASGSHTSLIVALIVVAVVLIAAAGYYTARTTRTHRKGR